jgi:hypothetical protein
MSDDYYLNQVKKCITFIFTQKYSELVDPVGTGFFVSTKSEFGNAVYLVTAKHVLQTDSGEIYGKILVRINTKSGLTENIELDLSQHPVLTHPDENVDLAATLLHPCEEYFDYLSITEDYFTNDTILVEKNIREGSRVFFAGLFSHFYGKQRNYPIVRFGNISLITNEKLELKNRGLIGSAHLYLVECQSLGGFSGSPVFFELDRITPAKIFHSPEIYLGGVMKGHYNDVIETPQGIVRELNANLALVTPCYLLYELLHTEIAKQDLEEAAED